MPSTIYWYRPIKTEQDAREVILSHHLQKKSRGKKHKTNKGQPATPTKPINHLLSHQIESIPRTIKLSSTSSALSRVQKRTRSVGRAITGVWKTPTASSVPASLLPIEMEIDDGGVVTSVGPTWRTLHPLPKQGPW